jgi:CHAT domain-containing protein
MTSFGSPESDGLLSFQEIFSLPINADIVLLSACDTAAGASQEVTRRALGELMGGGFALDGLVRSFLGAGARSVIASHWPVPEKPINATAELIGRLFAAPPGEGAAQALRGAQVAMMDKPLTSHPYYWAAFAIIGDGALPLKKVP